MTIGHQMLELDQWDFFAPLPYKNSSQNTPYKLGLKKDTFFDSTGTYLKGTVYPLSVVSVAERLRCIVGTRKVPGSNPVVGTAYTHSHKQLSIPLGLVNEYHGYSFLGTQTTSHSAEAPSSSETPVQVEPLVHLRPLTPCSAETPDSLFSWALLFN